MREGPSSSSRLRMTRSSPYALSGGQAILPVLLLPGRTGVILSPAEGEGPSASHAKRSFVVFATQDDTLESLRAEWRTGNLACPSSSWTDRCHPEPRRGRRTFRFACEKVLRRLRDSG